MESRKLGIRSSWLFVPLLVAFQILVPERELLAQGSGSGSGDILIIGIWLLAFVGSIVALVQAYLFFKSMMEADEGNERMIEVAGFVRQGANAYLWQQYIVVFFFFVVSIS